MGKTLEAILIWGGVTFGAMFAIWCITVMSRLVFGY